MPLGGGTFTAQNKTLPGAYINFVAPAKRDSIGMRGIVSLPLLLNWGADKTMISLEAESFDKLALPVLGYEPDSPELLLVREALKRARQLKLYRVNGTGGKARGTAGGLECEAVCAGTRGNDLKVAVQPNVDQDGSFDVITYLQQQEVHRQTVPAASEVKNNSFVAFSGGELAAAAATPLAGGLNGSASGAAYADYLARLELEDFDVFGYPGTDAAVKQLCRAFTLRLNEEEGRKVQCVLASAPMDHESILNVKNGVVLEDGTLLPAEKAVAWVAGASAAAGVAESLTNTAYEGAVDADQRYTRRQYEEALLAGEFVFYAEGGTARVMADVNSLVHLGPGKNADLTHNRVVRVLNGWANDVARIFGRSYLGAVTNSDTGRMLFKADLVALAGQYMELDAITEFDPADIEIDQGTGKRDVVVRCAIQPADSMEKLYMTVSVV